MIKESRTMDLVEIANSLSNDDVCELINMLSDRLIVWTKDSDGSSCLNEVVDACMNGCAVQLNLEE